MSLSTFSAHVRNLVGILESATGTSLVLLDEIAAGTDPVEGAALAEALLDALAGAGATDRDDEPLRRVEGMGERDRRRRERRHRDRPREPRAAVHGQRSADPARRTLCRQPSGSGSTARSSPLPASQVAPERLQVAELVAEAEAAAAEAQDALAAAARRSGGGGSAPQGAARRRERLSGRDRAGPLVGSRRAPSGSGARPKRSSTAVRAELEELRAEIRRHASSNASAAGPRLRPRRTRSASATAGSAPPPTAPCARAVAAQLDEPLPLTAPLAVGDPVVAAELGVRGTIAEIVGEEATVLGSGGLRVRVPVDRLLPDRHAEPNEERAGPASPCGR